MRKYISTVFHVAKIQTNFKVNRSCQQGKRNAGHWSNYILHSDSHFKEILQLKKRTNRTVEHESGNLRPSNGPEFVSIFPPHSPADVELVYDSHGPDATLPVLHLA